MLRMEKSYLEEKEKKNGCPAYLERSEWVIDISQWVTGPKVLSSTQLRYQKDRHLPYPSYFDLTKS